MPISTRILFMGTPAFAAICLDQLNQANFDIVAVFCQPDKEVGRGRKVQAPEVKLFAEKAGIPIFQPTTKDELIQISSSVNPDLIIVVAYGKKIPDEVLAIPKYKTLNIHGSLLPDYRGASCITQAILDGRTKTGISIIQMSSEIDAGAIISQEEVEITARETTASLTEKLAKVSSKELVRIIPKWTSGKIQPVEQDHEKATTCHLVRKENGRIDWQQPAITIERMIRAYIPWPNAYTYLDNKQVKILDTKVVDKTLKPGEIVIENKEFYVGTGNKSLQIIKLKPENSKEMTAIDYINGHKDINGSYFV